MKSLIALVATVAMVSLGAIAPLPAAQQCRDTKIVRNCTANNPGDVNSLYTCFYVRVPCGFQMGTIASALQILQYPIVKVEGGVSSYAASPHY